VATPSIDITYAAHTASCTFLLDSEGICRRIVMAPKGKRRQSTNTAARCVGAQYVASLDGSAAGGLVEMPRVGAAMLFARVDEHGRVSLVRTGVVTAFESQPAEDPFVHSGTVETSAPALVMRQDDYDDRNEPTRRIQGLRPLPRAHDQELPTAEYPATSPLRSPHREPSGSSAALAWAPDPRPTPCAQASAVHVPRRRRGG
jgi:hypothetical protein